MKNKKAGIEVFGGSVLYTALESTPDVSTTASMLGPFVSPQNQKLFISAWLATCYLQSAVNYVLTLCSTQDD